jgi:xanthine dehydrogenase YagR molybdenum-binding subunit
MAQEANSVPAIIGTAVPRVDGPLKVSGSAKYTSDFHFPGMVYAVPASSTIAKGRITRIDSSEAEKMPGVLAILSRENIGKLYRPAPDPNDDVHVDESRPPFEDDVIYYSGQYVALAVAETLESCSDGDPGFI